MLRLTLPLPPPCLCPCSPLTLLPLPLPLPLPLILHLGSNLLRACWHRWAKAAPENHQAPRGQWPQGAMLGQAQQIHRTRRCSEGCALAGPARPARPPLAQWGSPGGGGGAPGPPPVGVCIARFNCLAGPRKLEALLPGRGLESTDTAVRPAAATPQRKRLRPRPSALMPRPPAPTAAAAAAGAAAAMACQQARTPAAHYRRAAHSAARAGGGGGTRRRHPAPPGGAAAIAAAFSRTHPPRSKALVWRPHGAVNHARSDAAPVPGAPGDARVAQDVKPWCGSRRGAAGGWGPAADEPARARRAARPPRPPRPPRLRARATSAAAACPAQRGAAMCACRGHAPAAPARAAPP
jgi:hypothetical protein